MIIDKKDDELVWLNLFKQAYAGFPDGDIVAGETPDFVIVGQPKRTGVELRRLFRPTERGEQLLQARESNGRQIAQLARSAYMRRGLPPVRVMVCFGRQQIARSDIPALANSLAEIVFRNIPGQGNTKEDTYDYDNRDYFPDRIDLVRVSRIADDDTWFAGEAAWNPDCAPDYLQKEIDAKESTCASSRLKCDEVWLLLVTNSRGLASDIAFANESLSHRYSTSFNRVFLLYRFHEIFELNTSRVTVRVP